MSSDKGMGMQLVDSPRIIYAVYDSDVSENTPGREVAFIEQRRATSENSTQRGSDEIYFQTLSEAKLFVQRNYMLGAEYFSSKQLDNPDSLFYLLADKVVYLMA